MTLRQTQHQPTRLLAADPPALDFTLSNELEASQPPEGRGLRRDQVRLMVSTLADCTIRHTHFYELPDFLAPGDVLAINTSATRNAALNIHRADGTELELHLSTPLSDEVWAVELRTPGSAGSQPFFEASEDEMLQLPAGGTAALSQPYPGGCRPTAGSKRFWEARLRLPLTLDEYLERYGFPIRYGYVKDRWPLAYYQNVYATETGSAEMPSAGRGFTPELITKLVAKGIQFAPLILHTGVASPESHEPPYQEFYRVPAETARLVNAAHAAGKRIIAVGTTVVRALETVTGRDGTTTPGEGWTCLVVGANDRLRSVNGMLTGLHEPRASHLSILEALAGPDQVKMAYTEALKQNYLWHEFGDLHLILP